MDQKKYKLKTKTKINSKTAVMSIIIVVIAAASLVTASLLTPGSVGNFYAGSGNVNINITQPLQGWCVTNYGWFGDNGDHMTKESCLALESDGNDNTNWFMFCPDIAGQGERTENSCDCTATDAQKSAYLNSIIGMRDGLIEAANDGEITKTDQDNLIKFGVAPSLHCACGVYSAGNAPTGDGAERKITSISVGGTTVKGVHTFIRKVAKMFSKMHDEAPECKLLPYAECRVGRSYDGSGTSVPLTTWNNRNTNSVSAHDSGQGLDMNCQEFATSETTSCSTKTAALLSKVRGSSSGLNILQECTLAERGCWGDSSTIQVIHVDQKSRNDDDPDVKPCLYQGCDVSDCNDVEEE